MNDVPQKQCNNPDCRDWYPATPEFFHRDKNKKDGLSPRCKLCKKKYDQAYSVIPDVKGRHQIYQKAYCSRPGQREKKCMYDAEYRNDYYNRPGIRVRKLTRNREYEKRPDVQERKRYHSIEYAKRPDTQPRRNAHTRNYRARQKTIPGTHTPEQIQEMLKRQKYKCYYCNANFEKRNEKYVYHVDHTFPVSRVVGTDIPANDISYLVLACPSCNKSKGDKFPWEFEKGGRLL